MSKDFFDLHDAMMAIKTIKDFENFLHWMANSFDKSPGEWEHTYVASFLSSAGRVARLQREGALTSEECKKLDPTTLKVIANILLSAGSYE
jgi:hypothetical protein